jgi:FixJ family two-component response regulator
MVHRYLLASIVLDTVAISFIKRLPLLYFNGAIAERLVLSPRTVEMHVASLVAKAKVTGRSGLTRLANSGTAAD